MRDIEFNIRKFRRFSLALCLVGLAALVATLVPIRSEGFSLYTVSGVAASFLFFVSNLAFSLVKVPQPWMPIVQTTEIALIGMISAVASSPTSFGGMLIVAISVLLFVKYGVVRSGLAAFALLAAAVTADTVISHFVGGAPIRLILTMTAITAGAYIVAHYAFYDEIQSLLRRVRTLQTTAVASQKSLLEFRKELARASIAYNTARDEAKAAAKKVRNLEGQVQSFESVASPVDLSQFGLLDRETEVLRSLVQTRGRNREIGDTLGITESTVKSHFYRICNKVGVDTRLELVELFRWNWPNDSVSESSQHPTNE